LFYTQTQLETNFFPKLLATQAFYYPQFWPISWWIFCFNIISSFGSRC